MFKNSYYGANEVNCITWNSLEGVFSVVYRFVLAQGHFWASAGFKWQLAKKIRMAETPKRGALAYFFLGAFLLQRFELPVLVFVDEYPASLNVRYCLVKQQTESLFFYTGKYNNSSQWVSFARRKDTKNAMLTVQLNKIRTLTLFCFAEATLRGYRFWSNLLPRKCLIKPDIRYYSRGNLL